MSSTTVISSLIVSFILGYLVSYLNFFQTLASIFTDYSSIENKNSLLYTFIFLTVCFFIIIILIKPLTKEEAKNSKEYPFQTSAREQLARRGSF
ncbi:hypothetical protein BCR36DRAFT_584451 [Piromyces finnis]|uniref:Uncharacterized protein n=1 Tax=Piromyces finnis TaxID=1754191 RepID=A0A1Y1V6Q8_9FUNG|nr:hypothetical protein BCR36DRAFT_584451 [Piromyces finnis]|eukprot:ORX48142.1 hypothetical protein BCR36DRAFT_584451 [Piromyces finnis]